MIRSFKGSAAETIFNRKQSKRFPANIHHLALRKLLLIDGADSLEDLRIPPGNRLEQLKGDRKGQHSIRINDQWRICFTWQDGEADAVEIVDYHKGK
jgi:proteic killer suppression protein